MNKIKIDLKIIITIGILLYLSHIIGDHMVTHCSGREGEYGWTLPKVREFYLERKHYTRIFGLKCQLEYSSILSRNLLKSVDSCFYPNYLVNQYLSERCGPNVFLCDSHRFSLIAQAINELNTSEDNTSHVKGSDFLNCFPPQLQQEILKWIEENSSIIV